MENHDPVDQNADLKTAKILAVIRANRTTFSSQGAVVATWRTYQGRRLGPYYRIAYRHGGAQQSIYLGRSSERARLVRELLAQMQQPQRDARAYQRQRAQVSAGLREAKQAWDQALRCCGLHLKGFEIRRCPTASAGENHG